MKTYRIELTRDTLIKGKPMKKGALITVDLLYYDYLWSVACIKDADQEPVASTPAQNKTQPKAKK